MASLWSVSLSVGLLPPLAFGLSVVTEAALACCLFAGFAFLLVAGLTWAHRRAVSRLRSSEAALIRRMQLEEIIIRDATRLINVDLGRVNEEIDHVLADLGRFAGADRAYVFVLRPDGVQVDCTHEWCREGVSAQIETLQGMRVSGFPWLARKLLNREVVLVRRVSDLPPEAQPVREQVLRQGVESMIAVPLESADRVIGFIGFDSVTAEEVWTEETVILLSSSATCISNVLERRRMEEALRASEERFRSLVETTSDWIWEVDANGVYTYVSPKVRDLLGYEPEEILGRTPYDLMPPEEARRVAEAVRACFERCQPFSHVENVNLHKDGHEVVLDTSGVPIFDKAGKLCGFRGIDRDSTEQRRVREALRESEARYRKFLQISAEGIWRLEAVPPIPTDLEAHAQAELILQRARVMECNEVFARRNGFSRAEDVIGLRLDTLWREEHDAKLAVLVQFVQSGYRITNLESRAPLPDGRQGYFLDNFVGVVEERFLVGAWGTERDITERRQSEEDLRESEARYRQFLQISAEGIWRFETTQPIPTDLEERAQAELILERARVAECNDALARRYGFSSPEEVVGAKLDTLWVDTHENKLAAIVEFIRGGYRIADLETSGELVDGTRGYFLGNFVGLVEEGLLIGAWGVQRDVTARRRAQEELRRERDLVKGLLDTSPIAITAVDRKGKITFANDGGERVLGLTKDETTGLTYNDRKWRITDYEGHPIADEELPFRKVQSTGRAVYDVRHAIEKPDGARVLLSINATPMFTETGEFDGMVAAIEDVTEMCRAEEALRESEQRLRAIVESTRDWIWFCDAKGVHRYSNRAVEDLLGYPTEEIVGQSIAQFMHPDDLPNAIAYMQRAIAQRSGWSSLIVRWRHKDGAYRYLESTAAPAFDAEGELTGWYGADRDITERMKLQESLGRSEARLRALFAAMRDVILILDSDGRYLEIVPTRPDLLFQPADQVLGKKLEDVFSEEQASFFLSHVKQALERKEPVSLAYTLRIGEEDLRFAAEITPLSEDSVLVVARDITAQTEQYEQLLAAERARASLAMHLNEEINHRARNNLAMVSGLLQMQALQEPDPALAARLREAVARIRTFVDIHEKIYAVGAEEVDLLEVLRQVAATLRTVFANVGAVFAVEGESVPCRTRAATNLAVVTNELITNALKYGGPGRDGRLHIAVQLIREDGRLRITVQNSGTPVSEDFDAATQPGMGLRLASDMAAQHGGTFSLRPIKGGNVAILVVEETTLQE